MPTTNKTIVRARVSKEVKHNASIVLEGVGLSISEYIRIALSQLARGDVSFIEIPNAVTRKAIEDGRAGIGMHKAKDPEDLLNQLSLKI